MEAGIRAPSISPQDLWNRLGSAAAPILVDVRRGPSFDAEETMIAGAIHRAPDDVVKWGSALPLGRPVAVYCVHGQEVSQSVAAALIAAGADARFLDGGIARWAELGLPQRRKLGSAPGKWVTRERPKVDRIACPWLLRRFLDPEADILYAPADRVLATAEETGAIPFDVANVEFGHVGERCSFDAFMERFGLEGADPALDRLALIVRGADTGRPELTPQCPGLVALSQGLSATFADDHEQLSHGMVMYDALYAWCRMQSRSMGALHG
jgi:rhodanese-related sulfurtransferase